MADELENVVEEVASTTTEESGTVVVPTSIGDLERKMALKGTVKRTELYGAFIDIGVGVDAIIHVSQLGQGQRVKDALAIGQELDVWVDKVDTERNQIIVTTQEPLAVEWQDLGEGQVYTGKIVRLENFGAFVNIGAEKEGLVHVSEINHDFIKHPSQALTVGDEVQVQVLTFSRKKRRINLSIKALLEAPESAENVYIGSTKNFKIEDDDEMEEDVPTAMEVALRMAMGDDAPPRRNKKKKKGSKRRNQRRNQREDIFNRTLELADQ